MTSVIFLKMVLVPMLIKAALASRQPGFCALLYGAALFTNALMFDVAFSGNWVPVVKYLSFITLLAYGVFFALLKSEDYGPFYWATLFVGSALLLFL